MIRIDRVIVRIITQAILTGKTTMFGWIRVVVVGMRGGIGWRDVRRGGPWRRQ
jgi:hypothetical protein